VLNQLVATSRWGAGRFRFDAADRAGCDGSAAAEQEALAAIAADAPLPAGVRSTGGHAKLVQRLVTRTLGGAQLWADELVFHDWRIQRSSLSGIYRLLDGRECRHARGSFDHCRRRLEAIKREQRLPPMRSHVVVVLHGLLGWRQHMAPLSRYLAHHGQREVISVGYPSARGDLHEHARSLALVIEHLEREGVERLSFVAHSMGNQVLRRFLAEYQTDGASATGKPRIDRVVMIGPPNHGSDVARLWHGGPAAGLARLVAGRSAVQLGPEWHLVKEHLATPRCDFGIIAGGLNDGHGFSSLIDGDDDGLVEVSSTRLAGANDFVLLPVWHPLMMAHPRVQQCTLRFLDHGHFISAECRSPIAAE
jgi:hypothetical protein